MLRRAIITALVAANAGFAGYAHAIGATDASAIYGTLAVFWSAIFIITTHDGIRAAVAKVSPWK